MIIIEFIGFCLVMVLLCALWSKFWGDVQAAKAARAREARKEAIREKFADNAWPVDEDEIERVVREERDNEILYPNRTTREESDKLHSLGQATGDTTLTEDERQKAREDYHELLNDLFVQGKITCILPSISPEQARQLEQERRQELDEALKKLKDEMAAERPHEMPCLWPAVPQPVQQKAGTRMSNSTFNYRYETGWQGRDGTLENRGTYFSKKWAAMSSAKGFFEQECFRSDLQSVYVYDRCLDFTRWFDGQRWSRKQPPQ